MKKEYDDIINLPHHVSLKRKHMSIYDRAAQFASFAALSGFEDKIDETERLTGAKIDIEDDEERRDRLDRILNYLISHANEKVLIRVAYFMPDSKKSGGEYCFAEGVFKKTDSIDGLLYLNDGRTILLYDIYDIILLEDNKEK